MNRDRVREKIEFQIAMAMNTALDIEEHYPVALKAAEWQDRIHSARKDIVDQILSIPELAVLADDQSLPKYRNDNYMLLGEEGRWKWNGFISDVVIIQQDMLSQGWRKMGVKGAGSEES